jgi:hypothetical protein
MAEDRARSINELVINRVVASIDNELASHGCYVEQRSDFKVYKKLCEVRGARPFSEHFDRDCLDFYDGNCFYLVLYNRKRKVIGTIATYRDHMGNSSLAQLIDGRYPRLYSGSVGNHHAPAAYKITGNAVYMGDLWIKRKHRSSGIGLTLSRMATVLAFWKYQPDYIYGLVTRELMHKGGVQMAGYSSFHEQCIDWIDDPKNFDPNFWLVSSTYEDLNYFVNQLYAKTLRSELK